MKILMTTSTLAGMWTYTVDLVHALGRLGVDVALATRGMPLTPSQAHDVAVLPNCTVFERDLKLEWMRDPWDDVARADAWLLELACRVEPDVVHLNDYAHGALALGVPKVIVGHACVTSWYVAVRRELPPPEFDRYREKVREGLRGADAVVTPSVAMLRWLEKFYGPLGRTQVIPNARRKGLFAPGTKEDFVFSAGRLWDEAKNVAAIDRAAAALDWPVFVAGETSNPAVATTKLTFAQALGWLEPETLADFYARASIFILPARYEPFGLSVLEAATSGCALVLGDIDSLRENWDGVAEFVPPDDAAAQRSVLERLIAAPEERARLSALAQMRASTFDMAETARRYVALYSDLLQPPAEEHEGRPPAPTT